MSQWKAITERSVEGQASRNDARYLWIHSDHFVSFRSHRRIDSRREIERYQDDSSS